MPDITPASSPSSCPPPPAAQVIGRTQVIILVVLIGGYAALSQYSNSVPAARGLAAGLSLGPLLLIAVVQTWRWLPRVPALVALALEAAVSYRFWPDFKNHYEWADVAMQVGIYGLVAADFVRSLLPGRVPTCTLLAEKLHGPLNAAETLYLRRATWVWAIFYCLLATAILVLFSWASPKVWSLFVNFGTFGLIGLVFFGDHAIRTRVLPKRPGGVWAALRQSLAGGR